MYWDVIEVKPDPHHGLFLRFKDGWQDGPQELTGALTPLRDEQFFSQLFIDYGAVAWPGDIDLGLMLCMLRSWVSGMGCNGLDETLALR